MINFDDYTNENIIEHNSKWPYIPDKGIDVSKKFAKTADKKIHKETAKATGDLTGNKIADKITSASKNHMMKLIMKYQKKYIFLLKKDKKLLMN